MLVSRYSTLMVGVLIAYSALKTFWFCSLEPLLNHMLESDTRPQPGKLEPKASLPFVGREQDMEWVRRTVGKPDTVLSCDLPCWRLRRTLRSSYGVRTVPLSQVQQRLRNMQRDPSGREKRKSTKFLVVQGGSGTGKHMQ